MSSPKIKKQIVLITGATMGIGRQLAEIFAKNNHDIILTGRDAPRLDEISKIVENFGVKSFKFICDLKNALEIKNLADFAIEKKVTLLINNAGLPCPGKNLQDLTIEEINDVLAVNLYAPIILTKYLYEHLSSVEDAGIITLNSMVGREIKKHRSVYSASKWGLRGFCNSLNEEAREKNISVLSVYPTNVKTRSGQTNSMEVEYVAQEIYNAFLQKKSELILDGRINKIISN